MLGTFVHLAGLRGWSGTSDIAWFLATMLVLFSLYGLALYQSLRHGASARRVLLWAVLFRLALLPAGLAGGWSAVPQGLAQDLQGRVPYDSYLLYDNDVWRYLWDGHVLASGIDTYAFSPAELEARAEMGEPQFEGLWSSDTWDEIFDRVSYKTYRTVYPPMAQALFTPSAPGSHRVASCSGSW